MSHGYLLAGLLGITRTFFFFKKRVVVLETKPLFCLTPNPSFLPQATYSQTENKRKKFICKHGRIYTWFTLWIICQFEQLRKHFLTVRNVDFWEDFWYDLYHHSSQCFHPQLGSMSTSLPASEKQWGFQLVPKITHRQRLWSHFSNWLAEVEDEWAWQTWNGSIY